MSTYNLNLFGPGSSQARERDDEVRAPSGHHWIENGSRLYIEIGLGSASHLQRTDELQRSICGRDLRGDTNVRHSVRRSQACRRCLDLIESPQQKSLL